MQKTIASGLTAGAIAVLTTLVSPIPAQTGATRVIVFGTTLDPQTQMAASRQLAKTLANPNSSQWRAKGDQKRTYRFQEAGAVDIAFRVCVPSTWNGTSKLPLVMFLHGAGNTESSYLDQNNKQMVRLAEERGFLLVSPLGYNGAYGTFLRLPAVFGQQGEADKLLANRTDESERTNSISEKDVLNVLEMVLNEYPVDSTAMFLTGHSMGSGGTWYIGGKYASYWRALAPMSGPFVMENGYPWDTVKRMPIFVTEGTGATPSLAGSRVLRDWMIGKSFKVKYKEVNADHAGMVPLVLPDVFAFFDSVKSVPVGVTGKADPRAGSPAAFGSSPDLSADYLSPGELRLYSPAWSASQVLRMTVSDMAGRILHAGSTTVQGGMLRFQGIRLPPGRYQARVGDGSHADGTVFRVAK